MGLTRADLERDNDIKRIAKALERIADALEKGDKDEAR